MAGVGEIALERRRQKYSADHDDRHTRGELIRCAMAFAAAARWQVNGYSPEHVQSMTNALWPWTYNLPNVTDHTPSQNLAKAGALLAAELDRLKRLE